MAMSASPSQPGGKSDKDGGKDSTTEIVVLVTASSLDEAGKIAKFLIEDGLAACANILPSITSLFIWEQKLTQETEVLIVLKTMSHLFDQLADAVKRLHSYKVPEIIALPIINGMTDYLNWLSVNTRKPTK